MRLEGRGRELTDWTSWVYFPTVMGAGQKFVVEVSDARAAGVAKTVEGASVRPVPISTTTDIAEIRRLTRRVPQRTFPPDSGDSSIDRNLPVATVHAYEFTKVSPEIIPMSRNAAHRVAGAACRQ